MRGILLNAYNSIASPDWCESAQTLKPSAGSYDWYQSAQTLMRERAGIADASLICTVAAWPLLALNRQCHTRPPNGRI